VSVREVYSPADKIRWRYRKNLAELEAWNRWARETVAKFSEELDWFNKVKKSDAVDAPKTEAEAALTLKLRESLKRISDEMAQVEREIKKSKGRRLRRERS